MLPYISMCVYAHTYLSTFDALISVWNLHKSCFTWFQSYVPRSCRTAIMNPEVATNFFKISGETYQHSVFVRHLVSKEFKVFPCFSIWYCISPMVVTSLQSLVLEGGVIENRYFVRNQYVTRKKGCSVQSDYEVWETALPCRHMPPHKKFNDGYIRI